nr:type IV secretory system conjugative DNA transfer family protein [Longispora sp. (in: high G+C Gram-positive bacteria)]
MSNNNTRTSTGTYTSSSDYLIAVLLGIVGFVAIGTWATGQLAGLLFKFSWPQVPFSEAFSIAIKLPSHITDPRQAWPATAQEDLPGPIGFLIAVILVIALLTTICVYVARWLGRSKRVRGYASHGQLAATLSEKAALAKAVRLRPELSGTRARLTDVAVRLGRAHPSGTRLAASIENSVAVFAAPRQGKTSQIIIPWLTDWPGAAVVTSVRSDVLENTLTLREKFGPVAVVDLTGEGWPYPLSWSPLSGCEDFDKARTRADVMVRIGKSSSSDSTNAGFFGLTATNLLAAWMHTAAVTGCSMTDVLRWALSEGDDEPIRLLAASTSAHEGVAAMLDTIYSSPTETRSNMWATVL